MRNEKEVRDILTKMDVIHDKINKENLNKLDDASFYLIKEDVTKIYNDLIVNDNLEIRKPINELYEIHKLDSDKSYGFSKIGIFNKITNKYVFQTTYMDEYIKKAKELGFIDPINSLCSGKFIEE